MTDGSVPRMKRNGARLFKNPPQPHMCIQDYIQVIYYYNNSTIAREYCLHNLKELIARMLYLISG